MSFSFRTLVCFFLFLLVSKVGNSKTYYISTTGSNSNTGLSTSKPWRSIAYAASAVSPVKPGDIIYIKRGNYGAENVVFEKNGKSDSLITFQGYQTKPGDRPDLKYDYGDTISTSVMPLINGGNRFDEIGMDLHKSSYIVLKNIQILSYAYCLITGRAHHLTLDNIVAMNSGDINASYSGRGIMLGSTGTSESNYNTIKNCLVVNSSAEGLSINGNYNVVDNCKVFCDQDMTLNASTDYYIYVCGNNNIISNCYAERVGDLYHIGHGIGAKGNSKNNLFKNCQSVNMSESFYVRHRGTQYNTFQGCKAHGGRGIIIRDGASHNIFNACVADSSKAGLLFEDTSEDGGAQYAGRHNIIKNCIFKNLYFGIQFDSYDQVSPADSNLIANCTFNKVSYLTYTGRLNSQNRLVNCMITDVKFITAGPNQLGMEFLNNNFYNNDFLMTMGNENFSEDPMYTDLLKEDFHVASFSNCVDKGLFLSEVTEDFDGKLRPQGASHDIGAFESGDIILGIGNKKMPQNESSDINTFLKDVIQFEVFSILGQSLESKNTQDSNEVLGELKNLPSGHYILRVSNNAGTFSKKIFIE